jgi:hypothetical protein
MDLAKASSILVLELAMEVAFLTDVPLAALPIQALLIIQALVVTNVPLVVWAPFSIPQEIHSSTMLV